jgi:drug/metabolite transporter (DMT)-like permease
VWGSSFFFIAEALDHGFSAALITPLRILIGFLTLSLFPGARRAVPREDRGRIALLGIVWMAVPLSMFPFAEERVSSSVTGMLNGATPLFVVLVASWMARTAPSRAMASGIAVGFAGVVLISLPTIGEGSSSAVGVALILFALCCYGVAINLAVPLQQRHGALPVIWRAQAVALVATTPLGAYGLTESTFSWTAIGAMLGLGGLGTALAYVLAAGNAGIFGATRTSVTTYIIPVVSLLLGVVLRDEPVAMLAVAGCAVALLGASLVARSRR